MTAWTMLRLVRLEDVNVAFVVAVDVNNGDFDIPLEKESDGFVIFKRITN